MATTTATTSKPALSPVNDNCIVDISFGDQGIGSDGNCFSYHFVVTWKLFCCPL